MFGIFFGGWALGWGVVTGLCGLCGIFGLVGKLRPKLGLTDNAYLRQSYVLGDFTRQNSFFAHGFLAHGSTVRNISFYQSKYSFDIFFFILKISTSKQFQTNYSMSNKLESFAQFTLPNSLLKQMYFCSVIDV